MENIVAAWHPDRKRRVVIGAHFDTRPHPDREPDLRKRGQPFLGANDGASGVAVLMELAQIIEELKTTVGVDFVCFDGEELVYGEDHGDYFLGSTHFAQEYRKTRGEMRYVAAIVIDMVGDRQLEIYPDEVSMRESPSLVREVWGIARRLGASGFKTGRSHDIRDDHLPLLDAGIPAIDIIDFDYGPRNSYWHTTEDTPDKCSAASLAQVGRVLAEWLGGK
jgi:Zn-dependent M28 family amino/carboxypeptidase